MQDFTWEVFRQTGDIEAYLLYRGLNELDASAIGTIAAEDEADAPLTALGDGPITLQ